MPDEIEDSNVPPETPPDDPSLGTEPEPPRSASPQEKTGAVVSPAAPVPPPAPSPVFTADQIRDLASGISQGITQGFKPADQALTATPPAGPSPAELQAKIEELDAQIDLAVQEDKPIRGLQRQRDELRDQKFEVERLIPLRIQGANSINSLTVDAVRKSDPYFVKYEKEIMGLLGPSIQQGQALTVEIVKEALALIKGRHISEIINDEKEAATRERKLAAEAPLPSATTGRARTVQPKTPDTIRERFGEAGNAAFDTKRAKGYDENTFARRLGFKDKADWFARDDEVSRQDFNIGLDSVWDKRNNRWVTPDQLNEFYNG